MRESIDGKFLEASVSSLDSKIMSSAGGTGEEQEESDEEESKVIS
jgi:hypothetical protein